MHRRRLFVLKRHIMAIEKKIMGRGLRRKRSIMEMKFFWGLMLPLIGTAAGSACVFFLKNKINPLVQKGLLGFASGVMVAASVWSLLIPAMDMAEGMGRFAFVPAAVGLLLGFGFLLFMDRMIPHLHIGAEKSEGPKTSLKKTTMLVLAVTLHNIPEGMAVGVVFAGALAGNTGITLAGAFALAAGIAIQNFPEGAIISMPLKSEVTWLSLIHISSILWQILRCHSARRWI